RSLRRVAGRVDDRTLVAIVDRARISRGLIRAGDAFHDSRSVLIVRSGDPLTTVAENVVNGRQTRADRRILRRDIAVGIDRIGLVITQAGVEAPVLTEIPLVVDERRLRCL